MAFGLSGAAVAGLAIGGATLASGYMASKAAGNAADAQSASAQAGIAEQQRQFDAVQKLLAPYAQAGTGALTQQQNLIGTNGASAQQSAIDQLQSMPQYQSMLQAGTNSILQNASATGGLRGGNVQGALASFAPSLLAQTIQQQYQNLGGLTSIGQNAAAMTGNAGMQTGQGISNLLQQQGAAIAGGNLAQGRAFSSIPQSILGGLGVWSGLGGKF